MFLVYFNKLCGPNYLGGFYKGHLVKPGIDGLTLVITGIEIHRRTQI